MPSPPECVDEGKNVFGLFIRRVCSSVRSSGQISCYHEISRTACTTSLKLTGNIQETLLMTW